MAGALRYADANPGLRIRGFAPVPELASAAREIEAWEADGVYGALEYNDLKTFRNALKRPLPLVNSALTEEMSGVTAVIGDFSAFVETAVNHLRQLGVRSLAILVLEEGPQVRKQLVQTFLRIAKPKNPSKASLVFAADRSKLWNPDARVAPVPRQLADWMCGLPKPTGILCCHLGGGGYIIRCCRHLGLRVPEDVAVVGSDDTDLSLASEPTLTSVLLNLEKVGYEAMNLLMKMIAGEPRPAATIRLRCADLHVRESTGRRRPEICDIAGALACIQEHACRGITVGEVIRQTQRVSRMTFHRRFRESVGQTPAEAIRERQLQEVRRLLTGTELPIAMISDLAGFSSPKILARLFKNVEAISLRDYRRRRLQRT
jgi:LacI family transcriptional regulator